MERIELHTVSQPPTTTPYVKSEFFYAPDNKSWSWFGGGGLTQKITGNFSVDGYFAGKSAGTDTTGYLADFIANYKLGKCSTDVSDITFGTQTRFRYNNCGSETEQLRLTPLKISANNKFELFPFDEVYAYPAYATFVHDLKTHKDTTKFGSIVGVSKNIDKNASFYFEVEADTKDERFSDSIWGVTIGYKRSF